jgi:hypothetical protein
METVYIPLGADCSLAYQLSHLGLRCCALPFDWLLTPSVDKLIECLKDNFSNFFEGLVIKNSSNNFPLLDDNWHEEKTNTIRVTNYYNFHFLHDFQDLDDLPKVKEKYLRRINRFNKILQNENIHKIFIRLGKEKFSQLNEILNSNVIHISYSELPNCSSWKRNEVKWKKLIN